MTWTEIATIALALGVGFVAGMVVGMGIPEPKEPPHKYIRGDKDEP